ncbi:hypothetical protein L1856_05800 [Streptomyces sp. Tue 6430]|nr:hypothetical protein [Streptomyces sp. Tue 6430]
MAGEFSDPYTLLNETDWSRLDHGGGPAAPETPTKLAGLASGDIRAVTTAMNHLWNDLLHQGSLYSATPTAALYVSSILSEPQTQEYITAPQRSKLLEWLAEFAYAVSISKERQLEEWFGPGVMDQNPIFSEARAIRPIIFRGVEPSISDSDRNVTEAALLAAIHLLDDPKLTSYREVIGPKVRSILATSSLQSHRIAATSTLEAWGENIESLKDSRDDSLEYSWNLNRGPIDDPPF